MNSDPHMDDKYTSDSTSKQPGSASYGGAMFSDSQHFVVAGGTFHNVTNHTTFTTAPTVPPDFRSIPLGDIYLRDGMESNRGTHTVGQLHDRGSVRRVYSARIVGLEGNMTVAIYQGNGAEKEWQEDILRHSWLRHPYFVQLCGITTSSAMHAAVFHDDLIPFEHFMEHYRHLPLLSVYIIGYCSTDFDAADDYFSSVSGQTLNQSQCTLWICRSTGQLRTELRPNHHSPLSSFRGHISYPQRICSLNATDTEDAMVIDSLTLEQYHNICYWNLSRSRTITMSPDVTVNLGGVYACYSEDQLQDCVEVAFLPDLEVDMNRWYGAEGGVMDNGCIRFDSGEVLNKTFSACGVSLSGPQYWLSQANHIFNRLQVTSNFENYIVVDSVEFRIQISATTEDDPSGYLFVCLATDLQTGPSSFRWPDCPAYWSLDPTGAQHLSLEEATGLGFPSIQLTVHVRGDSWDASVYAGLRRFYLGKAFYPDSQDVTQHLGEPLFQLSTEIDPLFAHVDPELPVSKSFRFFLNVQLGLILLLSLFCLYEHGWYRPQLD